jgi:hypothetical protein
MKCAETEIFYNFETLFRNPGIDFMLVFLVVGDRGSTVVKVLCYKSKDRWFVPNGVTGIFH